MNGSPCRPGPSSAHHRRVDPGVPDRPPPKPGAPNVVVIVLDDLGFAQLGCFGSDIATPNIDGLAADGLRYNRFHVTAMCSPTRAAHAHRAQPPRRRHGVRHRPHHRLPRLQRPHPGVGGHAPRILRDNGWSTYAVGKWHLIPRWEQSAAGPFTYWPLGQGFERYYGFLAGDTNQWTPGPGRATTRFVDAPARPEDGYHLTEDLADRAIRHASRTSSTPSPTSRSSSTSPPGPCTRRTRRLASSIDAYARAVRRRLGGAGARTRFDRQVELGIVPESTTLTERPPWIPDWASLPADERRLFARFMEVFAGFLSHTDEQIGRVLGYLREIGKLDDTLVLLISDNGTSAEGGPHGSLNEHRFTHDKLDDIADTIARIGRPRRVPFVQPLPVGLGVGRATRR